jgi:hypothetical protein
LHDGLSREDITTHKSNTNQNEFKVKPSFDTWSFGVVLFQLCTGRKLFSDVGTSDDNLKDRADQDRLMNWNERSLNTALLKLGDDEFEVKDLLKQCLQPQASKRPSMKQILEHKFFGEKDGEDGKSTYWKELDGSVAVPMTRGQTTFVGVLGFIVLIFTCLHILQYVLATDSSDALRKLVGDVPTEEDEYQSLTIDFTTHASFNASVAEWKDAAHQTLDTMNTWKDYEGAAEELNSGMRDNFELSGPLVDVAKYAWIVAALFMAYNRKAFTSWPKINDELKSAEDIDKGNSEAEKREKAKADKENKTTIANTWENYLQGKSNWILFKKTKTNKIIKYEWKGKEFLDLKDAIQFEKNHVAKNDWNEQMHNFFLVSNLDTTCPNCVYILHNRETTYHRIAFVHSNRF